MAVTLTLRPTHRDTIPSWLGRAARGLLLHTIESIQPALSAVLHDLPGDKPFTASTLSGVPKSELLTLEPQHTYTLRYTSLAPDLTRLMQHAVIPHWQQHPIRLHDQPLNVEDVHIQTAIGAGESPLTYAALLEAARAPTRDRSRITLRFITPTYFKVTGQGVARLPTPEYVFGKSLFRRWNTFSPLKLPDELPDYIAKAVEVEAIRNLNTDAVSFERAGKNRAVGFVGDITYRVSPADELLASYIRALAMFAEFSGVGAQTADGLGQTQMIPSQ